ncbi:MAG: tetratricopeptide repeat protein [Planctomycetota bacterium]
MRDPTRLRAAGSSLSSSHGALIAGVVLSVAFVALPGCSSAPKASPELARTQDSRLKRLAEDGQAEFLQGDLDVAIANYQRAAARAWMLDDPKKTAPMAFNLASCYLDRGDFDNAASWNLEARCEYARARLSTGNTWLLESKIARSAGDLIRAEEAIAMAACTTPPCRLPCSEPCDPQDPCQECQPGGCFGAVLGCDDQSQCCEAVQECKIGYQIALEVTRGRLAIEHGDVNAAMAHLTHARCLVKELCRPDLRGEIEHVAALLHLTKGESQLAAIHFDREIIQLRRSGAVRQIPSVLEQAAEAYLSAGLADAAVDRWCRAARVHFGRGELRFAWRSVTRAASLFSSPVMASVCELQLAQNGKGTSEASTTLPELLAADQDDEAPSVDLIGSQSFEINETNARRLTLIAELIRDAIEASES